MALPRFFINGTLPPGGDEPVDLSAEDLRHLTEVLRARPGDRLVLVDASAVARVVEVRSAPAGGLFVRELEILESQWEPRVTLVLGMAKGAKVDEAVQGAVEVGV